MEDKKLRAKTIDTIGSIIIAVSDCDDKDDSNWANVYEESDLVSKDPVTTAMSAISRLADDLGEKTTLACT